MADLFQNYPVLENYKISQLEGDNVKRWKDISVSGMDFTVRGAIGSDTREDINSYIPYVVSDGETAIILADRIYDNPDYYWIIYMFNNIIDFENEWPLERIPLDNYIKRIYSNPQSIHHYESIATGAIVDGDHPFYDRISITNYDYEVQLNDKKRNIKLPIPDVVQQIADDYNTLIAYNYYG